MTHFTAEMIAAAKGNNLDAVAAIIAETDALVLQRSRDYATRGGRTDHDLADDLAQAGRIRIWECVGKFEGDTPAQFMAFLDKALHSAMGDQRRKLSRPGVFEQTSKDFEIALTRSGGDPYEAARFASTDEMGPRKMAPDRAYAALLSWLGTDSLDRPLSEDMYSDAITLGDVIAAESNIPADLLDHTDYESTRRTTIREQVHRALGLLSERQRHVLKADHGISPIGYYGDTPDAVLAGDMGVTTDQLKQARIKGKKRFFELYQAGARAW
ncbi:sigma-70 family RNA polymerase sigma factor [Streptomyces syringium]|uniref:sigma-70 family RNA polymerase sigma factor n=1 Tax=Streptomyces syringium TaxID=76729 RepID=UPI0036E0C92B